MVEVVQMFSVLLSNAIVDLGFSRFVSSLMRPRGIQEKKLQNLLNPGVTE